MNKNIKKNKTQEYHHYTFQRLKKKNRSSNQVKPALTNYETPENEYLNTIFSTFKFCWVYSPAVSFKMYYISPKARHLLLRAYTQMRLGIRREGGLRNSTTLMHRRARFNFAKSILTD